MNGPIFEEELCRFINLCHTVSELAFLDGGIVLALAADDARRAHGGGRGGGSRRRWRRLVGVAEGCLPQEEKHCEDEQEQPERGED